MQETYIYTKPKSQNTKLNVWCAFPAVYNFGMSSLGFLTVFKHIDTIQDVFAERIFTDTKTTAINLKDVDLLSFSFSFELDYVGILQILDKYNIPFLYEQRGDDYPLIFGGGPVLSAKTETLARFNDFIMIGDAEPYIKEIIEILRDNNDKTKQEKLELLKNIEGVYIPKFKNENYLVKKVTSNHNKCTATPILTPDSFFPNTYIIEIERGCPQKCAFCLTSYINNPIRFFPYENIIEEIEKGLKYTDKLALLGALICSHPDIDKISQYIIDKVDSGKEIELSVSSLRADYVSDKVLEMLYKCGQRTATIAIEAGSERLRKVINKHLKKEDILKLVDKMYSFGFRGLKIYGILGLPTETYEDLDEFIELCKEIKNKYKGFNLIPSFSTFVPKAQTPFSFAQREDTKTLEKKNEYIKKQFAKIGIKARVGSAKWDYVQSLLSRGGQELTQYLIDVYHDGGTIGSFKKVYKEYSHAGKLPNSDDIALNSYYCKELPWNFIKYNNDYLALEREYNRLLS